MTNKFDEYNVWRTTVTMVSEHGVSIFDVLVVADSAHDAIACAEMCLTETADDYRKQGIGIKSWRITGVEELGWAHKLRPNE